MSNSDHDRFDTGISCVGADVRELQRQLSKNGISVTNEVDVDTQGPGSFVVIDPDGNPVLIDQHR